MKARNMRVMLASEHPGVRSFLKEMVEADEEAVVVGEAENAVKSLWLARNLRPDVAIIDSQLPHSVGLDTMPQSRIGGLDVAQAISDEIPNARVMLLNSLDRLLLPPLSPGAVASFAREDGPAGVPLALRDFSTEAVNGPVFASIEIGRRADASQRVTGLADQFILFGLLGIMIGLVMMVSLILIVPGILAASLGGAAVVLGLVGKLTFELVRRRRNESDPDSPEV